MTSTVRSVCGSSNGMANASALTMMSGGGIGGQPNETSNAKKPRVPVSFQALFLASNKEKNTPDVPPPTTPVASKGKLGRGIRSIFRTNKSGPAMWVRKKRDNGKKDSEGLPVLEISIPSIDMVPSPQEYLESIWGVQGYPCQTYNALETAYHNSPPTDLQLASYSITMQMFVRNEEVDKLSEHLAAGLSPNACNGFGESLLHYCCRRGHLKSVQVLIRFGARMQVCDDYGRTPLHDACWCARPNLGVVDLLLQQDLGLLRMRDRRGYLPLDYVKEEHWMHYQHYFQEEKDHYWPLQNQQKKHEGQKAHPQFLTDIGPNQSPVPDPVKIVPLQVNLATLLSQGRITPSEANVMKKEQILAKNKPSMWNSTKNEEEATTMSVLETDDDNTTRYDSEDDEGSDSYDDESGGDTSSIDDDEWHDLLESLGGIHIRGGAGARPVAW